MIYSKYWKKKIASQEYPTPQKLFTYEGEVKTFLDKQKLREFITMTPAS